MKFKLVFLIVFSLFSSLKVHALVVVVSEENIIQTLNKRQVVDIYMGRFNTFPNGKKAMPIDFPAQSKIKSQFYVRLVQQTEEKLNAYWARLLFSGRASPPKVMNSVEEIVNEVKNNDEAIGYIPESAVTSDVKVVFKFAAD